MVLEFRSYTLKIWRQSQGNPQGEFKTYAVDSVSVDISFLEMIDTLNEELTQKGEDPVAFDSDCREGICGSCGAVVNGQAHGPLARTALCQLHMRYFPDGQVIVIEPWRAEAFPVVKDLVNLGFKVVATSGTQKVLEENGIEGVEVVLKLHEGRPHVIDWIKNKQIQFIINTPSGEDSHADGRRIRRTALDYKLPIITTIAGAKATVAAIRSLQTEPLEVKALQDYLS